MPYAMVLPQSVRVGTAVYVADRGSGRGIYRYDPLTQQWTKLLQYRYQRFTMAEMYQEIVLVGGYDGSTVPVKSTNVVTVYSASQRTLKQPYPPMKTPRSDPAVCTYNQHLVVAGGFDGWIDQATVEILDMSFPHSQTWLTATPLPMRCSGMSATIIHDTLYLLGDTLVKQVLSVSLPALTQLASHAQWYTLPDAPLEDSIAIAIGGSLLALGGNHDQQRSSAIHVYNQAKNTWSKVGDLPTERTYCTSCLLRSGEILVAGGKDRNGWTSRIDLANVL